jgi:hypothetical protein
VPEITHVVIQIAPVRDDPGAFELVGEAGYPDTDDVIAATLTDPINLGMGDPQEIVRRDFLDDILEGLSEEIENEIGLVVSAAYLKQHVIIQGP